jgi:hypothetical protein
MSWLSVKASYKDCPVIFVCVVKPTVIIALSAYDSQRVFKKRMITLNIYL